MTKHRINDAEEAALASAMSKFRAAAFEHAPRPSAELRAHLELSGASGEASLATFSLATFSSGAVESTVSASADTAESHKRDRKKRVRQMLSCLTGLGVLAKIVLASSVASAAILGAGAAGVLPAGAQDAFNTVVASVSTDDPEAIPTESPEPDASASGHPDNFGGTVSDLAHELGKGSDGRAFGESISDAAKDKNKNKNKSNGSVGNESIPDENESDEESTSDDEPRVDTPTGGKPAVTPGGKQG